MQVKLLIACLACVVYSSYFHSIILHRENLANPELPLSVIAASPCKVSVFLLP